MKNIAPQLKKFLLFFTLITFLAAPAVSCSAFGEKAECDFSVYTDETLILSDSAMTFNGGKSVLDILKAATRAAKIQMDYSGAGALAYVRGIDNLYEFDKGPESGWVFYVNGELSRRGAGAYKIYDGDVVVWKYVLSVPDETP